MIRLECFLCGKAVAFAAEPHPKLCLCGGRYVFAGSSDAGRLRRERDSARRMVRILRQRLAATVASAQRLARAGRPAERAAHARALVTAIEETTHAHR